MTTTAPAIVVAHESTVHAAAEHELGSMKARAPSSLSRVRHFPKHLGLLELDQVTPNL
jgi:hypothetical protein